MNTIWQQWFTPKSTKWIVVGSMVAIAVITLTYLLRPTTLPPAQATPLAGGASNGPQPNLQSL
ncbi:MAG: hypothetical protein HC790_07050 [Acaryochloridaceae cyanobacterium CSU_3_4]|nr:hypothetical protein [Acaryochloridaceae cyanobacterium CSU_3_4]